MVLASIVDRFDWAIHAVLLVGLLILLARSVGVHYIDALKELIGEFRDLIARKRSVGSQNMLMILVLTLFGLVLVAAAELHEVIALLAKWIGADKASYVAKSASFVSLFYVLASLMGLSLVCVVIDGRSRK